MDVGCAFIDDNLLFTLHSFGVVWLLIMLEIENKRGQKMSDQIVS